jgi:hypothetical protein
MFTSVKRIGWERGGLLARTRMHKVTTTCGRVSGRLRCDVMMWDKHQANGENDDDSPGAEASW